MSETESKETPKKPFLLAYRDNSTFSAHVPLMIEVLSSHGYEIQTQVFPAETSEADIKDWIDINRVNLESSNLVTDKTVMGLGSRDGLERVFGLDEIVDEATQGVLMGSFEVKQDSALISNLMNDVVSAYNSYKSADDFAKEMEQERGKPSSFAEEEKELARAELKEKEKLFDELKEKHLENIKKLFLKILSLIPLERRKGIKKIFILTGVSESENQNLGSTLDAHEIWGWTNTMLTTYSKAYVREDCQKFADHVKGWLIESGIDDVSILSDGSELPEDFFTQVEDGEAYLICNRHTRKLPADFWGAHSEKSKEILQRAGLMLPIATFLGDVMEKIGVSIDPQEIQSKVREVLNRKLGELEED